MAGDTRDRCRRSRRGWAGRVAAGTSHAAMTTKIDHSCPHCGTTAILRTGQVTVPHPTWCPRSRTAEKPPRSSHDRRGRCAICGGQVHVFARHRHEATDSPHE